MNLPPNEPVVAREATRRETPELEYTSKLEALIAATGEFATRVGRTLVRLIFQPRQLVLESANGDGRRYVPARTFLVLSTFLSTTAIRGIIASVKIFLATVSLTAVSTCAGAEYQPMMQPSVAEMLKLPSVSEMFFVTLPTLAIVFLLSTFFTRMLAAGSERSAEVISTGTFYIVALQQILIVLGLLPLLLLFRLNGSPTLESDGPSDDGMRQLMLNAVLFVPLLAPLVWPPILLARLTLVTLPRGRRRFRRIGAAVIGAPLVCLVAAASVVATAYPFALRDLGGRHRPRPYVEIRPVTALASMGSDSLFDLVITNVSPQMLMFAADTVWLSTWHRSGGKSFATVIRSWNGQRQPGYILDPQQSAYVSLHVVRSQDGAGHREGGPAAGADFSFTTLDAVGEKLPLVRTFDLGPEGR